MSDKVINISRALTIDGWMSESELSWLALTASRSFHVVEIGTYLGRSARAIGDNLESIETWDEVDQTPGSDSGSVIVDGCLYCIDPYEPFDDPVIGSMTVDQLQAISEQAQNNLADLIQSYRVVILQEQSSTAVRHFQDHWLDFVFIDGEHIYKSVSQDIKLWLPKVKRGGVIAGHDYGVHEGVAMAVNENEDLKREIIYHPAGSIWAVNVQR